MSERIFSYKDHKSHLSKLIEQGYVFASFPETPQLLKEMAAFVLMRHDVDFHLGKALVLAEMEASLNITSTFFFLVRTEHYNIFSKTGTRVVNRILKMGHHLGLHFDCAAYDNEFDIGDLSRACHREVDILEDWFQRGVSIVSYHRPNRLVLTGNSSLSAPLPHTYMPAFVKDISYFADSRGLWRFGHPTESKQFQHRQPLHILVHPAFYDEVAEESVVTSLGHVLEERKKEIHNSMVLNCIPYRKYHQSRGKGEV